MELCTSHQNHHHLLMVVTGLQWGKTCWPNRVKLVSNINGHLKQLYMSNKTEHFSYKGGCCMCGCAHIKAFKEDLAWAKGIRLWVISNIMLFKTVILLRTKE